MAPSAVMAAATPWRGGFGRWLREPSLHFLVAGAVLVAASRWAPPPAPVSEPRRVVFTLSDVARIRQSAETRLRRPVGTHELPALIEDAVRTEILAREAARLGLDRDDPIVKARLAEKMDFLAEDTSPAEPTNAEIDRWIAEHPGQYAAPSRIDFDQVAFTFAGHGEHALADARATLASMSTPELLPEEGDLRFDYADYTPQQLVPLFGADFTEALFALTPGPEWRGPIRSRLGWHLVRVGARVAAQAPSLTETRNAARNDWVDYRRVEARRRYYAELRARYVVVMPDGLVP